MKKASKGTKLDMILRWENQNQKHVLVKMKQEKQKLLPPRYPSLDYHRPKNKEVKMWPGYILPKLIAESLSPSLHTTFADDLLNFRYFEKATKKSSTYKLTLLFKK